MAFKPVRKARKAKVIRSIYVVAKEVAKIFHGQILSKRTSGVSTDTNVARVDYSNIDHSQGLSMIAPEKFELQSQAPEV